MCAIPLLNYLFQTEEYLRKNTLTGKIVIVRQGTRTKSEEVSEFRVLHCKPKSAAKGNSTAAPPHSCPASAVKKSSIGY